MPNNSSKQPDHESVDEEYIDDPKIPWHFWIAIVLVAAYLGYRFVQMIVMAITNLF